MTANYIQEVPNSFSVYIRRRGQYLVDVHGTIIATIDFPVHFKDLQEGVEVEMSFRPRATPPQSADEDMFARRF